MVKKVLLLVLGFGLITTGVVGITTSVVDEKNRAALREQERIQEEAKTAVAEERRKAEEKWQELDKLAMTIEEERQRVGQERRRAETERRRAEALLRSKLAATEEQKRAAAAPKTAPPKDSVRSKVDASGRKPTLLSRKDQKTRKNSVPGNTPRRSLTARAPKPNTQDQNINWITRKAGLEAARLSEPVEYHSPRTRELILAEPYDYGSGSVRVRVRVWRESRLVKDAVISFPEASLREPRRSNI